MQPITDNNFVKQNSIVKTDQQLKPTDSKIVYVAKAAFWTLAMFFNPIVDFFTQGLSDFLGLETLRHGTSFQNYVNIRIEGGNPAYSFKSTGATAGFSTVQTYESEGYLYVSKDSESLIPNLGKVGTHFMNRVLVSRFYCGVSASTIFKGKGWLFLIPRILITALSVLIVPTVKFRFTPQDVINSERFQDDPASDGAAYRTKQAISTENIGLRGIITQGFKGNVWARMKAHPGKCAWGLTKLIPPIGLLALLGVGIAHMVNAIRKPVDWNNLNVVHYSY